MFRTKVGAMFLGVVYGAVRWTKLPSFVFWMYVVASAVAFVAYLIDKHAAVHAKRRIPETTLHLLDWMGGWPGAFLAQGLVRHKTQKPGFQIMIWLTVVAHCGALVWWASTHR